MMRADDEDLSPRERDDLRDLVVAGAGLVDARRARRGRIAVGVTAVAVIGGVAAASVSFALGDRDPGPVSTVSPAPDARDDVIAFAAGPMRDTDIYVSESGGEPRLVLGGEVESRLTCPAFSPDGTKLAVGAGSNTILVASVSASGEVTVTDEYEFIEGGQDPCPLWSADGRWIAAGVGGIPSSAFPYDDAEAAKEVVVIDTILGDVDRIAARATDLEWAPEGDRLYIADERLFTYAADSGALSEIPGTGGVKLFSLSPDGTSLVGQRARTVIDTEYASWWDLVVMGTDGSDERVVVVDFPVHRAVSPAWSPDGDHVVYLRRFDAYDGPRGGPPNYSELAVLDVSGLDRGVTGEPTAIPLPVIEEGDLEYRWLPVGGLVWSPDSRAVAFTAYLNSIAPSTDPGQSMPDSAIFAAPIDGGEAVLVYAGEVPLFDNIPWAADQSWWAPR